MQVGLQVTVVTRVNDPHDGLLLSFRLSTLVVAVWINEKAQSNVEADDWWIDKEREITRGNILRGDVSICSWQK